MNININTDIKEEHKFNGFKYSDNDSAYKKYEEGQYIANPAKPIVQKMNVISYTAAKVEADNVMHSLSRVGNYSREQLIEAHNEVMRSYGHQPHLQFF
jgi:putative cell wall-binding protein